MVQSFLNSNLGHSTGFPPVELQEQGWREDILSSTANSYSICTPGWKARRWRVYWRSVSERRQLLDGPPSPLKQRGWTTVAAEVRHTMVLCGQFSSGHGRKPDWDLAEKIWWWNYAKIHTWFVLRMRDKGILYKRPVNPTWSWHELEGISFCLAYAFRWHDLWQCSL